MAKTNAFDASDQSCHIGIADKGYKKSTLNKNIKAITDSSWQMINTDLLGYANAKKIEKGRQVGIDCTIGVQF